jgi:hypothetical protein
MGYSASRPRDRAACVAGMGFYAAVWPLIDKPIANSQIALPFEGNPNGKHGMFVAFLP